MNIVDMVRAAFPKKSEPIQFYPTLYPLEPIGVNGALEAVETLWFCTEACRTAYRAERTQAGPLGEGYEETGIDDSHCTQCDTALV